MSLHSLPAGTITLVLEAIARDQHRIFDANHSLKQYSVRCPWCEKKRESFSVNNADNFWNCFYGCGKGGVLTAVIRLHPDGGIDRPSALAWLASRGFIPPADRRLMPTFEEAYQEQLTRLCTKNGVLYPSTAFVRNSARASVAHRFGRIVTPEPVPWYEAPEPWDHADPDRRLALAQATSELATLVGEPIELIFPHIRREWPLISRIARRMIDLRSKEPIEIEPIHEDQAKAIARLARYAWKDDSPLEPYVSAHAAAILNPQEPSRVKTWYDPSGEAAANIYFRYAHALAILGSTDIRPWPAIERSLHDDREQQRALIPWIHSFSKAEDLACAR